MVKSKETVNGKCAKLQDTRTQVTRKQENIKAKTKLKNRGKEKSVGEEFKIVAFKLRNDEYGFMIDAVQEVRRMKRVLYVPEAPDFVEGVIKLRGEVLPVIDLRIRLGLAKKEHEASTRIIIVNVKGRTLGVIVDSVHEVLAMPQENIEKPDAVLKDTPFLKGVGKVPGRMILIVDIDQVLTLKKGNLWDIVPKMGETKRERTE